MKKNVYTLAIVIALIVVGAGVFWYLDSSGDTVTVYETPVDSGADCSSYEKFNAKNSTCYFECTSSNECKSIDSSIQDELATWGATYKGYASGTSETALTDGVVATYTVQKGERLIFKSGKDTPAYLAVWKEIADLSPDALSDTYLKTFQIVENPNSDSIAYVEDTTGKGNWNIAVNIPARNQLSPQEKKVTLIHELGHIITLNSTQVVPNTPSCSTLELSEGCAKTNSYVNKFVAQFWSGKKVPYSEANYVTEYAATENVEDLAESLAVFVVSRNNTKPQTLAERKVAFFAQFPELVAMREQMRSVLSRDIIRARKSEPSLGI